LALLLGVVFLATSRTLRGVNHAMAKMNNFYFLSS
jgi:hypothetical protein